MRARQEAMDVAAVLWGEQDQPWKLIVDLGRHFRDETRTSTSEMLTRQEITQGKWLAPAATVARMSPKRGRHSCGARNSFRIRGVSRCSAEFQGRTKRGLAQFSVAQDDKASTRGVCPPLVRYLHSASIRRSRVPGWGAWIHPSVSASSRRSAGGR